jgi:hypothetical protein
MGPHKRVVLEDSVNFYPTNSQELPSNDSSSVDDSEKKRFPQIVVLSPRAAKEAAKCQEEDELKLLKEKTTQQPVENQASKKSNET